VRYTTIMKLFKGVTLVRALPWLLVIAGIVGLICSFVLTLDEVNLLKNPHFQPSCNLNPVISCGSVMKSTQAHAFSFPNPFIGLAAFSAVLTVGMALLAGAQFKRWFWLGLQLGTVFGIAFVHWLFFNTVYRINALCPYCMVVWTVTISLFWYILLYNLEMKHIKLPAKWARAGVFVRHHHLDILVLWLLIIAALILQHFWYYYGHYFHLG
jgi:uncharacterized membrane protein